MTELFSFIVYDPLYNILVYFYDTIALQDFGLAIIATTLVLKGVLYPLSKKQIESQKKMQDIQPKIKEIQKKYKDDKERQAKELMGFYKKNKVNPLGGCLPLVVQLIFLIAIYRILLNISEAELLVNEQILYGFVSNPGHVDPLFLGMLDLSRPNVILAVVTAIAQYWQTKMLMDKHVKQKEEKKKESEKENKKQGNEPDFASMMTKQMLYIGPALTLFIGMTFAAGLMLYWLTSTIFMIVQQKIFLIQEKKGEINGIKK
jgi:YidC/Oxa1 family membrane protein insertase